MPSNATDGNPQTAAAQQEEQRCEVSNKPASLDTMRLKIDRRTTTTTAENGGECRRGVAVFVVRRAPVASHRSHAAASAAAAAVSVRLTAVMHLRHPHSPSSHHDDDRAIIWCRRHPAAFNARCRCSLITDRINAAGNAIWWWLGVTVASLVASTKLINIEPG